MTQNNSRQQDKNNSRQQQLQQQATEDTTAGNRSYNSRQQKIQQYATQYNSIQQHQQAVTINRSLDILLEKPILLPIVETPSFSYARSKARVSFIYTFNASPILQCYICLILSSKLYRDSYNQAQGTTSHIFKQINIFGMQSFFFPQFCQYVEFGSELQNL